MHCRLDTALYLRVIFFAVAVKHRHLVVCYKSLIKLQVMVCWIAWVSIPT